LFQKQCLILTKKIAPKMKDDFSKISDLIVVLEYMKKGKKKNRKTF
jgi:hypothetical protein